MDIQLKRGLLEACVLKVLTKGDSYGYQLVKDVGTYIDISESTLYPVLRRLESGGCLLVYSSEHNGRLRKYYQITDIGLQHITAFLQEWEAVRKVYAFIEGGDNDDKA